MKQITLAITIITLGLFYMQGCSTGPIGAQPDVVNEYPKVAFNTETLSKTLKLNPAVVSKSATGLLVVSQPIRNASDEVLDIEYRFIWKDVSGQPIQPQMNWRYKRLEPRLNDTISASATSDAATDYQIQLRWARP